MKFAKTKKVKSPERGTSLAAGIDFFVPDDFGYLWLEPGENVLIDLGIKVSIPKGYALVFCNKSGIANKQSLVYGSHVIDEDYQGILKLDLHNIGIKPQKIEAGQKIIQGLLIPVLYSQPNEVSEDELFTTSTERGEGGFGSTGK